RGRDGGAPNSRRDHGPNSNALRSPTGRGGGTAASSGRGDRGRIAWRRETDTHGGASTTGGRGCASNRRGAYGRTPPTRRDPDASVESWTRRQTTQVPPVVDRTLGRGERLAGGRRGAHPRWPRQRGRGP